MYISVGGGGGPGGAGVPSSQGCEIESRRCPCATGRFPQCTITGLTKAMVCGAPSMGHCT